MMARRLAIDTNLLLLLVVGQVSRSFIRRHRRLRNYGEADFELLTDVIRGFEQIILTPNASTEASNLIVYGVTDPLRAQLMAALGLVFRSAIEHYRPSAEISLRPEFLRLGLTDSVWLDLLDPQSTLLTDDDHLYVSALSSGARAFRFSDVKSQSGMT